MTHHDIVLVDGSNGDTDTNDGEENCQPKFNAAKKKEMDLDTTDLSACTLMGNKAKVSLNRSGQLSKHIFSIKDLFTFHIFYPGLLRADKNVPEMTIAHHIGES